MTDAVNISDLIDPWVIPGDDITSLAIPNKEKSSNISIGVGIRLSYGQDEDSTALLASTVGKLNSYNSMFWIDSNRRFYEPQIGDEVVGIIEDRGGDFYRVNIFSGASAVLSRLSFEGATKRSRPELRRGDVIFAIVQSNHRDSDTELTCVSTNGIRKDWASGDAIYGELANGVIIRAPHNYCRLLRLPSDKLLSTIGKKLSFEIAVGVNGVIWFRASTCQEIILLRKIILGGSNINDDDIESYVNSMCVHVKPVVD